MIQNCIRVRLMAHVVYKQSGVYRTGAKEFSRNVAFKMLVSVIVLL